MRVFGIGIDVVEVDRIERLLGEGGNRFIERVFTPAERDYCDAQARPGLHYAARFAAKEAVAKAFGTGIGEHLAFLDVEVARDARGAPRVNLGGAGMEFAARAGIREVLISLTHARAYAAANAVALCVT
jgi:holo-[acyl-carrier protein] synthase